MSSTTREIELLAGQEHVLLPDGLFFIDKNERPRESGWYRIEYDPFDQFVHVAIHSAPKPGRDSTKGPCYEARQKAA
jgi:hypothetical protein